MQYAIYFDLLPLLLILTCPRSSTSSPNFPFIKETKKLKHLLQNVPPIYTQGCGANH